MSAPPPPPDDAADLEAILSQPLTPQPKASAAIRERSAPPPRRSAPQPQASAPPPAATGGGAEMDEMEALLAAAVQQKRAKAPPAPAPDPQAAALLAQYSQAIGDLQRVPQRAYEASRIDWSQLDGRCRGLYEQIDGHRSFEALIAQCGLDQVNATYVYAVLVRSQLLR